MVEAANYFKRTSEAACSWIFFAETGRGATNGREWIEPRNTRNTRKGNSEPRMDTNGHEYHLFIIRIHWLLEGWIDGCTPSLHPRLVLCHCRVVDVCPIWAGRGDGGIRLPHPHSKNRVFRSCYSCFLELIEAGDVILGYLSGNLLYCLKDN